MLWLKVRVHKTRVMLARYFLRHVLPAAERFFTRMQSESAREVNKNHDLARLRLDICRQCPLYSALKTCTVCRCYMPVKAQITEAKCPKGRW